MDAIEQVPTIGISVSRELPGKQNLVLQSLVNRDCEQKDLDAVLDKLRIASDRQFAFGAVVQLKLQLEQEEKMASDHAMRMAQADENMKARWNSTGRKGDLKLSQKEEQDQRQAYAHAEESKKRIAKVKSEIAEFQAKIGPQAQLGA